MAALASAGFSFKFELDEQVEQTTKKPRLNPLLNSESSPEPVVGPSAGSWGLLIRDYVCAGLSLSKGCVCRIDWNRSGQTMLYAIGQNQEAGLVPSSCITLMHSKEDLEAPHLHTASHNGSSDFFLFHDSVFQPPTALTSAPHFCEHALDLEPGLASFCWPLTTREFLTNVFKKKAFSVLGSGQRLSQIEKEFMGFNVPALLSEATKIIVWMKTTTGEMQYLEAPPDIALSCYLAGHSLYFNPSLKVQKTFIKALCQDLNIDFGLEKDGGFGGDLEIFAVNGAHDTPWHFDGQENFTVQLKGQKRWSVLPSHIHDPLTNYHPRTSNVEGREANLRRHRSYTLEPLEAKATADAQSVVLRPGSVLYVPCGMWHRVVADSEGSLSINFSIDGARWMDVLLSRIGPLLWRLPEFRGRVEVTSPAAATQHVDGLLRVLQTALQGVKASDFLPPSGFLSLRDEAGLEGAAATLPETQFRINPLCVLTPASSPPSGLRQGYSAYTVSHGWSHPDTAPDYSARVDVNNSTLCVLPWLLERQMHTDQRTFRFQELCDNMARSAAADVNALTQLCSDLVFHGFLSHDS